MAGQHQRRGISRVYVLTPKKENIRAWHEAGHMTLDEHSIVGYFALSSAQVMGSDLPAGSKLPSHVPVVRLGRLAVDRRMMGMKLGSLLLMEAIAIAAEAARSIGVTGLFVDSKPEASAFYEKFGFRAAESDPLKLWLSMKTILSLLDP